MNESYARHVEEREAQGIPPLPLDEEQVRQLVGLLENPSESGGEILRHLLAERVPPGVDPAARVKADVLAAVAEGERASPLLKREEAVDLLGTMQGGFNVPHLVRLLDNVELAPRAAAALAGTILIFENIEPVRQKMERGNRFARQVLEAWAEAQWFLDRPPLPAAIPLVVFRVEGEVNTDDLSPAGHAPTRPDIPLHALSMGESRFPGGIETIAAWRAEGRRVAFVSDVLGTGSSRKSATNSLLWHIGEDIPHVPNKRRGGVCLGAQIAPIFFNTFEDAGGLPIRCDVEKLEMGMEVTVHPGEGRIVDAQGREVARFDLAPATLADEVRAGGRVPLLIGRKLTEAARRILGAGPAGIFASPPAVEHPPGRGYTLAQKLVGRACGREGVLPGETCEPATSTVGSQDTTGPMTRDELVELACLDFQADLVMQSFCHTAAYPKEKDRAMHATLPVFFEERGGVALRPGDGIIHSWLNRMLLPDTVGTGGDSHTRFPLGISFAAGSGLVAFAAALGFMPLDMPESVLVRFVGDLQEGLTLRDVVNAIPLAGIEAGLVDRPGEGTKNVFNSRIMEMEGMRGLAVEQAFELTCAAAERSAAAATIELDTEAVAAYCRSNIALLHRMIEDGYREPETLSRRIASLERWLEEPALLRRDADAAFAAELEVDLSALAEPVVACPNLPDQVRRLGEVAGAGVDEVFLGSCMTNITHFRVAAAILSGGAAPAVERLWIAPPTRMDRARLEAEGILAAFEAAGARIEVPGCSLCMGNQARVADGAVVFSTSTRNFDHRMGRDAQVYLGSAALAACTALLGRIPTPEEYFALYRERITPRRDEIAPLLDFCETPQDAEA